MDTGSGMGTYLTTDHLDQFEGAASAVRFPSELGISDVGGERGALLRLLRENERILSEIRRVFHRLRQAREYALTEGSDPEIGRVLIENLRRRRIGLCQVLRANRLEMEEIMESLSTPRQPARVAGSDEGGRA